MGTYFVCVAFDLWGVCRVGCVLNWLVIFVGLLCIVVVLVGLISVAWLLCLYFV